MANQRLDRRDFLRQLGAGAAAGALGGATLPTRLLANPSPNEQIGIGVIGVGSLGGGHHLNALMGMSDDFRLLAVADVDQVHLDRAVERAGGGVEGYRDYRRLLDRQDLDAVLIATPDHWHALTTIHACEAGKDVYCEKPLSLTIGEGREMVDAVRRAGRVCQTGSQQRSDLRFRWACELVRNGAIGELERVTAALHRGPSAPWQEVVAPPPNLDWEMWLGPSPWAEYRPARCHWTFRWFFDSSGGMLTDWGAHHNDIAQWGMGVDHSGPRTIEGAARFDPDSMYETPVQFEVRYLYESGVELTCTSEGRNGVTFHGSEGSIFVSRGAIEADPPEILDTPPGSGEVQLYQSPNHHRDFAACVRSRRRPICDVEIGHRSVTVCHLGNLAIRLGRKLDWDPEAERFRGDEQANRLIHKPNRQPWVL